MKLPQIELTSVPREKIVDYLMRELDSIVLTVDLPEYGLRRGDVGTVVLVHGGRGYEAEFMTLDGETVAVVSLSPDQVRQVHHREIANARELD